MSYGFDYQGKLMRPPSEADSILIQVTLGCSHNKCAFCNAYNDKKLFAIKPEATLTKDFAFAKDNCRRQNRVFLMDGDALIIPHKRLVWILEQIKIHLPWVTRVSLYANGKGVRSKTDAQLRELASLGLTMAYFGVESGHAPTLQWIQKGSTAEQLITAGQRLEAAGIEASVTLLLGIAGRANSLAHAKATAELLNKMQPSYMGTLSVIPMPGTKLMQEMEAGRFELPTPQEILLELKTLIENIDLPKGIFRANHASNYLSIKTTFPHGKAAALKTLEAALAGDIDLKPEWFRAL